MYDRTWSRFAAAAIGVPQYFKTALRSPYFLEYVNARSYGMKMPRLGTEDARAALLPLPPLDEQARIVARVDELMRLCDALEAKGRLEAEQHARLLGTLLGTLTASSTPEELAANWQRVADHFDLLLDRPEAVDALEQTILQLAVRGLLVPQLSGDRSASSLLEQIRESGEQKKSLGKKFGAVASEVQPDEVPFEVPDSWAWSRFGQIAEIASDLVQPAGHGSEWQVAPDCIEKGTGRLLAKRTVADADVKSANHRFHPGQIIYSKIRPSLSKAVIVDFAGLCSADMYPINAKISPQYLLLVILSRCFLDQVAAAENRVKMPKLNQESLTAFLVPVPPLAEQARIVARVTELRRLCTALRQRLAASQTIQSLLADALVAEVA
jgi:type I restriction enzyme S subunit